MPQFTAPGAAFADEFVRMMTQQAEQRRQALLDELTVKREDRLGKQTDANTENMQANTAAVNEERAARVAANKLKQEGDTRDLVASGYTSKDVGMPGRQEDAARVPGLFNPQMTLPAKTSVTAPSPENPDQPLGMEAQTQVPTGESVYRGTGGQQTRASARQSPANTDAQRALLDVLPDDQNIPANFADLGKPEPGTFVFEQETGRMFQIGPDGTKKPMVGPPPKDARVLTQSREPQAGSGGGGNAYAPFVITQQRADGIYTINGRTGEVISKNDRPLGDTAGQAVAMAQTNMELADSILDKVKPEMVGIWDGRFKSAQEAITGGDPQFTAFSAAVSSLRNAFINMRTGAAMSEPEATRIITELSDVNQPIATFVARTKSAQNYLRTFLKNRVAVGTGRALSPGNVDAITGQPRGDAAPTGGAPGSPRPSAADFIRNLNKGATP